MKEFADFVAVQASPMVVFIRPRDPSAEACESLATRLKEMRAGGYIPEWVTILLIENADVFVASGAEIHSGHLSA